MLRALILSFLWVGYAMNILLLNENHIDVCTNEGDIFDILGVRTLETAFFFSTGCIPYFPNIF